MYMSRGVNTLGNFFGVKNVQNLFTFHTYYLVCLHFFVQFLFCFNCWFIFTGLFVFNEFAYIACLLLNFFLDLCENLPNVLRGGRSTPEYVHYVYKQPHLSQLLCLFRQIA